MRKNSLLRLRFARLLTLVCFFQFSGLNSGYTLLTEVSPLNVSQSVLPARAFAAGLQTLSLGGWKAVLHPLDAVRLQVTRWTLALQKSIVSAKISIEKSYLESGIGFEKGMESREGLGVLNLEKQERYLKQEKESWVRLEHWKPGSKEVLASLRGAGIFREADRARPKSLGRRTMEPWSVPKLHYRQLAFSSGDEDPAMARPHRRSFVVTPSFDWGDFFRPGTPPHEGGVR